ncbi:putative glycolipid-binding domain-containing protein [Prauserella cavernicola]|uniref:Glycolipid-binding domain-containing protein n=1 Tax=Prauserella cavernicola TaxID=2800127 RepID=A0A934V8J3_9PSEU|nr:putative glycolipid-binding domain-containing protein [Prauserella cavernicola]MBK1788754.1 putative glycolipid-binding domain-containing protein [Prauserella cavernicola]
MAFAAPPASAAWSHELARLGFEVAYFERAGDGYRIRGCTTAVEHEVPWIVGYDITVDGGWRTRRAEVTARWATGARTTVLDADGDGHWRIDDAAAPRLDGCLDVDLESSAMTNTLPVHRLALAAGDRAAAPAAYVRAADLTIERLEQAYRRLDNDGGRQRYDYAARAFEFSCTLLYDESGLVLSYPGIAAREA